MKFTLGPISDVPYPPSSKVLLRFRRPCLPYPHVCPMMFLVVQLLIGIGVVE